MIFARRMDFLSPPEVRVCVDRDGGQDTVTTCCCWDQFLCLAVAQLPSRECLRDIQACLRGAQPQLYHMGFRRAGARIAAAFAQGLLATARSRDAAAPFGVDLAQTVAAFAATPIELCLALCPWATYRKRKGAVKLHPLLDLRGNIPPVCFLTPARVHAVTLLDRLPIAAGAFHLVDRAYLAFTRRSRLHRAPAFFVPRAKRICRFRYLASRSVDWAPGGRSDQTLRLDGFSRNQRYPDRLRRIRSFDAAHRRGLACLTPHFPLPALTVAQVSTGRWPVALVFEWLTQHLRSKAFSGTSANAVQTQLWVAVAVYPLGAIVTKRLHVGASLSTMLQVVRVALVENIPLGQALMLSQAPALEADPGNQLKLFA
jgi:hypothetical protein